MGPMLELDDFVPPPAHLSPAAQAWWRSTIENYVLAEHHLKLLQILCENWDRYQEARELLGREGLVLQGRQGPKPHPAAAIAHDAALIVMRATRELDLDVAPPVSERIGPPGLLSNRRIRRARQTQNS
jgi:P27 family predicted phage terminase small subunit